MENKTAPRHPAKYSDVLLPLLAELLEGYDKVLDPFAGVGKLRLVRPDAYLLELEPEWATVSNATLGDALDMPWADGFFDAVATSPTYGNRLADNFTDHQTAKHYKRNTYRHALGRPLHPNNSGKLAWGPAYREFHIQAWAEVYRVLRPGGRFILNISDHIRRGQVINVSDWQMNAVIDTGFVRCAEHRVTTPRNGFGANGKVRVGYEMVYVFDKPIDRG